MISPAAAKVLARDVNNLPQLQFLSVTRADIADIPCRISRSGYTGEDGFEIAVPAPQARPLAEHLLTDERVAPVGLGARDSLRLEASLCLYGHDLNEQTTPVEAAVAWAIPPRRRQQANYPGANIINAQLRDGPPSRRVGIRPLGRAPAREGAAITNSDDREIGQVTSGGFGPTVDAPIAMGYVRTDHAAPGTSVQIIVRDRPRPAQIIRLPFVPHQYHRLPTS